ncbi:MAG: RnfABCDGE type electron transport complex subunit D [Planctomycetota bacterium]|jgi:Na+-transporting NADH:ubiquinone oxidoreductase subunit B
MALAGYNLPDKLFVTQPAMLRVCYALVPLAAFSVYLFGWRALALIAVSLLFGIITEAAFALRDGRPVTSAVIVTCLIFSLSLPPTLPLWMVAVGIIVAVAIGKMAFGGMGLNIFNPAMVGRCFIYITFPIEMTGTWAKPFWGGTGGFSRWAPPAEAVSGATPLVEMKQGIALPLHQLLIGNIAGSLGETSALLILFGAGFILYKKAAPWRIALSCFMGGIAASVILVTLGVKGVLSPVQTALAGSFLFGTAFVVTEPITGAKTHAGQWIYGTAAGSLAVLLRVYSNFAEGIMFSVLLVNACVPILDRVMRRPRPSGKAAA